MCLFTKLIINRKYVSNNKNGGDVPIPKDNRVLYVPASCGKCMECRRQKARGWSIRLQEELKEWKPYERHFITLTFSNESIKELSEEINGLTGYELDNEIATLATRRFLERWRKKYKKSVKHWLITELGQPNAKHQGTENIHLHGIIFTDKKEEIANMWQYGYVWIGDWTNEQTVNYCVKYATKVDQAHKEYNAKILTSPGIGSKYTESINAKRNKFKSNKTEETYVTRDGAKMNLPTYWRNKLYTEEEREALWLQKLDKLERYVDGSRIDISIDDKAYFDALRYARRKNKRLGYGDDSINWERRAYENKLREINMKKRLEKVATE